ncbi:MAG: hypothetical protein KatS3mg025_1900 [Bacteroidia bacterium]|nr:MAG: hypothetical protein KatS3mg025_1900 [Bacteroidia bacterium]
MITAGWTQTASLSGQVVDPQGQPLPYTMIRLPETGFQTVAGKDGRFTLAYVGDQLVIELRHLGYRTRRDTVTLREAPHTLVFKLYPQEVRLPAVTITEGNEDPALLLIRKAIAAKDQNRSCLSAFRTETYTLFTARIDSHASGAIRKLLTQAGIKGDILFMSEATSVLYFQPPDKYREEIIHSRVVGTRQYSFLGSWIFQGFDPYGERLSLEELTPSPLILPLARDALMHYRYRLIGSYWDEEGFFYKIAVEPKSRFSPCIEGYLVLGDESYALAGLEWAIKAPRPIQYAESLGVRVTFLPVGTCYQIGELNFKGRFRVDVPIGKIQLWGEGYASYKKYQVLAVASKKKKEDTTTQRQPSARSSPPQAQPTPPRKAPQAPIDTFRVEQIDFGERVRVFPGAERPSSAFWDSVRSAPLDSSQWVYIQQHDSVVAVRDSLGKRVTGGVSLAAEGLTWSRTWRGSESRQELYVRVGWPFYTHLEGWGITLQTGWEKSLRPKGARYQAQAYFRYGFGWRRVAPLLRLSWTQAVYPLWRVDIAGGVEVREPPEGIRFPLLWNALGWLLLREAPWQGYAHPLAAIQVGRHWHRTLRTTLQLMWDRRPATEKQETFYESKRIGVRVQWAPGTYTFTTPARTELLPPEGLFELRLHAGAEVAFLPWGQLLSLTAGPELQLSISPAGKLQFFSTLGWQNRPAPWADALYPVTLPFYLHKSYTALMRWPLYQAGGPFLVQNALSWLPKGALVRLIPLVRQLPWDENFTLRVLYTHQDGWHAEGSFYLSLRLKRTGLLPPPSIGIHTGLWGPYRAGALSFGLGVPTGEFSPFKRTFP